MERRWSGRATADVTRSHQMTGHGAKFGRKQEEAIAALLSHRSIDDAAQAIHIAPRTLLRWLQLVEFNAAYRKARRAAVSHSVARLQQATCAAASTLLKVMMYPSTPPATPVPPSKSRPAP